MSDEVRRRLEGDAGRFRDEAAGLDVEGFAGRALDAIGAAVTAPVSPAAAAMAAAGLAEEAGVMLDTDERDALARGMATGLDGRWAQVEVGVAASLDVVTARVVYGLFVLGERVVVAYRDRVDRHEAFVRLRDVVDGTPMLRARLRRTSAANGGEGVEVAAGPGVRTAVACFVPPQGQGLRGFSADLVVTDVDPGAEFRRVVLPVLAARPNGQVWCLDT